MIKSFKSKALKLFYDDDDGRKLPPEMTERIRTILSTLDAAGASEDMNQPTFRLHALKGKLKGFHAVTVRANWRVVFKFERGDAFDVDFVDYH